MKSIFLKISKDILVYFILCAAIFAMLHSILPYISFKTDVGFLLRKQEYLKNKIWLSAFYIHVFTCIVCLCAGVTQFSNYVLQTNKSLHKLIGKIYAYNIFFINFPMGLIMAIYANGEFPSKLAFSILDILWFWFTLKAILEIKKGDIKKHREFMIRSFALTFSAITLRSWRFVFEQFSNFEPGTIYMIDAWMGFVPNLIFAEWFIKRRIISDGNKV